MALEKPAKKIWKIGIFSTLVFAAAAISMLFMQPSCPDDIFCVVSVNGGAYAKENRVFVKHGDDISVLPVFVIGGEVYSRAGIFAADGENVTAKRLPQAKYCWYQINPQYQEDGYDNFTLASKKQFNAYLEPISYAYAPIEKSGGLRLADIAIDGFGAYYLQAMPKNDKPTSFDSADAFFLEDKALQIIYRSDDSYLGYLSELMRSPFIMYPKSTAQGHQTDLLIGSDCAEFAIYGMRRLGADIPYCGPRNIYQYLTQLSADDYVLPGDILHYGSQVAVYFESRGMPGIISDDDILLQSYGAKPYFTTAGENGGLFGGYRVYRWRE